MEHLKQIEDYPDYFVNDQGEVYSNKSGVMKKLKPIKNGGYLIVNLSKDGVKSRIYIHRLIAQAFVSNPENKPCVNHKDGNKHNNCVDNLEWCTHQENMDYFHNVQKPLGEYEKQSEELKARGRRWCEEHRKEINTRAKRWREEHREELKARGRHWREEHREELKAYGRRWREEHKEEI